MKLNYWKIQCHDESNVYSIRAKTKKEAIKLYNEDENQEFYKEWGEDFAYVEKIVIHYDDAFDLVNQILSEDTADCWAEKRYKIK
tara:strand:- start:274 stop:528 length:255 start_codon:yes stop_codon:yes gene_type:complete